MSDYNLQNIRTLLTKGFSAQELRRFCHDMSAFRPVYAYLAWNTGKAEIIDHLLEYAQNQVLLDAVLEWAKEHNPTRYKRHQPYTTHQQLDHGDWVNGFQQSREENNTRGAELELRLQLRQGRHDEKWRRLYFDLEVTSTNEISSEHGALKLTVAYPIKLDKIMQEGVFVLANSNDQQVSYLVEQKNLHLGCR